MCLACQTAVGQLKKFSGKKRGYCTFFFFKSNKSTRFVEQAPQETKTKIKTIRWIFWQFTQILYPSVRYLSEESFSFLFLFLFEKNLCLWGKHNSSYKIRPHLEIASHSTMAQKTLRQCSHLQLGNVRVLSGLSQSYGHRKVSWVEDKIKNIKAQTTHFFREKNWLYTTMFKAQALMSDGRWNPIWLPLLSLWPWAIYSILLISISSLVNEMNYTSVFWSGW